MQPCSEKARHLQRLRAELNQHGLDTQSATNRDWFDLRAANVDASQLNEQVFCQPGEDNSVCSWRPWRQRIGSAAAGKDATAPGLHALMADLDTLQAVLLWNQALAGTRIPYGPV